MSDHSRRGFAAHPPSSARAAAYESEIEAALGRTGACADIVTELSTEAAEALRRHVSREVRRLELAGPGRADEAAMRLRAYLADPA